MTKADEMFADLEFMLVENEKESELVVYKRQSEFIYFYKDKTIELSHISHYEIFKAINEKCKELGWIE